MQAISSHSRIVMYPLVNIGCQDRVQAEDMYPVRSLGVTQYVPFGVLDIVPAVQRLRPPAILHFQFFQTGINYDFNITPDPQKKGDIRAHKLFVTSSPCCVVLLLLILAGLSRLRSQQLYFIGLNSTNQSNSGFNGAKFYRNGLGHPVEYSDPPE